MEETAINITCHTKTAKQCKVCGVSKPLGQFSPMKRGLGGVSTVCHNCDAARALAYRRQQAREKALYREAIHPLHCASITDLAYIAGIIDGEGSIGIYRNGERKENYVGRVNITNTSTSLMSYLREVTGVGKIRTKLHYGNNGFNQTKPCYEWSVTTRQALILLRAIYPYLLIKRKQAAAVISLGERKEIRINKYLTHEERIIRKQLYDECKSLNSKGI